MSSLNLEANSANTPYNSLAELRKAHTELLKRHKEGETEEVLTAIETFIADASASGAVLDNENDRYAAQSLLDYWMTVIYRARRNMADATLAEFNPKLAPKLDDSLCPYRGLNAFQESDKDLFFGRKRLIEALIEKTKETRLLFIVGPSGSGKSSVVLAGLLPALKSGAALPSKNWQYFRRIVPGSNPLKGLAHALGEIYNKSDDWVAQEVENLKKDPQELRKVIESVESEPGVLIVDQFEEVFTLCADDELRDAFINNLVALTESSGPRHLAIITLRTDFETYLAQNPTLMSRFERGQVRVMPLTSTDLSEAIEEPARRIGLKFEDGVVEALVKDILGEPAGLPLLQFALLRLWKMREDGRNRITLKDYRRLGGARRALALTADEFYQSLSDENQITAKRILLRLARPSGNAEVTSNPVKRRTLYFEAPYRVDEVLEKLRDAGLVRITKGETKENDKVEVAHEALVRNWGTLVDWIERERATMRQRLRLTASAEQWLEHGKDKGGLLGGTLLEEALKYDDLNDLEKEFVQVSRAEAERVEREKEAARERERELEQANMLALQQKNEAIARSAQRLRSFLIILAALFLLSIVTAVYAVTQARRASASELLALSKQEETNLQKLEADRQRQIAEGEAARAREQSDLATQRKKDTALALEKSVAAEKVAKMESEKAKKQAQLAEERRIEAVSLEKKIREVENARLREVNALQQRQVTLFQKRDEADDSLKRGHLENAANLYGEILPGFSETGDTDGQEHVAGALARAHRSLAEKFKKKKDAAKAEEHRQTSERMYRRALDLITLELKNREAVADEWGMVDAYQKLAQFHVAQGEPEKAEQHYKNALGVQASILKSKRRTSDDVDAYNDLVDNVAEFYRSQNNPAMLERLYLRVLEDKKQAYGESSAEVLDAQVDLARFYHSQRDYVKAEAYYLASINVAGGHFDELAEMQSDLADLYRDKGDYANAQKFYMQALSSDAAMPGALEDAKKAEVHSNLAEMLRKRGEHAEALKNYKEALKILDPNGDEKTRQRNSKALARIQNSIGELYLEQPNPDYKLAAATFNDVNRYVNESFGDQEERDELARSKINLAGIRYKLAEGDPEAEGEIKYAEELLTRARLMSPKAQQLEKELLQKLLDDLKKNFAQPGPNFVEGTYERILKLKEEKIKNGDLLQIGSAEVVINGLEDVYRAEGDYEKLAALYRQALDIRIAARGGNINDPDVYGTFNNLGEVSLRLKDYKSAEESYHYALNIVEEVFGKDTGSPLVITSLMNLAGVHRVQGKYAEAESLYQRAMLNLKLGKREDSREMADLLERYADVLENTKRATEAKELKEKAAAIRNKVMPPLPPEQTSNPR